MRGDGEQLGGPPDVGEGDRTYVPPEPPSVVAEYCAACGVRAPDSWEEGEARLRELRAAGWLVLPSRSLHGEHWRLARNAMCGTCQTNPSGFARALLAAWGLATA